MKKLMSPELVIVYQCHIEPGADLVHQFIAWRRVAMVMRRLDYYEAVLAGFH